MDKINVLVKLPGQAMERREIPNTLEALQEIVQGYIETVTIFTDLIIICNEEGKLKGMTPNFSFVGELFVGPVIFVGAKDEEFDSLPVSSEMVLRRWLR